MASLCYTYVFKAHVYGRNFDIEYQTTRRHPSLDHLTSFSSIEIKTHLISYNCLSLEEGSSPVGDLNKVKTKKSMILPNSS